MKQFYGIQWVLSIPLLLGAVMGCAVSETVRLQNRQGDTVTCGPFTTAGRIGQATVASHIKLRDCISDFQRQGYERMP